MALIKSCLASELSLEITHTGPSHDNNSYTIPAGDAKLVALVVYAANQTPPAVTATNGTVVDGYAGVTYGTTYIRHCMVKVTDVSQPCVITTGSDYVDFFYVN